MKLLTLYATRFAYTPRRKTLIGVPDRSGWARVENVLIALVHAEPEDVARSGKVVTKLVKNVKWSAGKNETRHIVLHSFTHLSDVRADPQAAQALLDQAEGRLVSAGYQVDQTPFGYLLDLEMQVPGLPFARVFKTL